MRVTAVIIIVIMRVMMIGMDYVDEASLFEERVRGHGRPYRRQKQRKHASDKPHASRLNKVSGRATVEMVIGRVPQLVIIDSGRSSWLVGRHVRKARGRRAQILSARKVTKKSEK